MLFVVGSQYSSSILEAVKINQKVHGSQTVHNLSRSPCLVHVHILEVVEVLKMFIILREIKFVVVILVWIWLICLTNPLKSLNTLHCLPDTKLVFDQVNNRESSVCDVYVEPEDFL